MGDVVVFPYRAAAYLTEEERERLRSRRMLREAVEAAAREFETSLLGRSRPRPSVWEAIVVQRLHEAVEYGLCSGDWEGAERLIDAVGQPQLYMGAAKSD